MADLDTFTQAVDKWFGFLVEEFGFSRSQTEGHIHTITFSSRRIRIAVYFATGREPEIAFSEIQNEHGDRNYHLGDLTLVGFDPAKWDKPEAENDLSRHIGWFAGAIKAVGEPLLRGDSAWFAKLRTLRNQWTANEAAMTRHESAARDADLAFKVRNYRRARVLLESVEERLTKSERAKLTYCRKHDT